MAVLEKTCTINAPVDKVFSFLIKPENWKKIDPKIIEITDVQSLPNGGYRFSCKYKIVGGLHYAFDIEYTGVKSNERFSYRYTCCKYIKVDEVLSFTSENGKTNLTYKIISNVHIPLINALLEKLFMKMYEPMLPTFLDNLKAKTET